MDDLVQHLMDELAMDGLTGCSPSRLDSFIQGFHYPPQPFNSAKVVNPISLASTKLSSLTGPRGAETNIEEDEDDQGTPQPSTSNTSSSSSAFSLPPGLQSIFQNPSFQNHVNPSLIDNYSTPSTSKSINTNTTKTKKADTRQKVDEAYLNYAWKCLLDQDGVVIRVKDENLKDNDRGEEDVEMEIDTPTKGKKKEEKERTTNPRPITNARNEKLGRARKRKRKAGGNAIVEDSDSEEGGGGGGGAPDSDLEIVGEDVNPNLGRGKRVRKPAKSNNVVVIDDSGDDGDWKDNDNDGDDDDDFVDDDEGSDGGRKKKTKTKKRQSKKETVGEKDKVQVTKEKEKDGDKDEPEETPSTPATTPSAKDKQPRKDSRGSGSRGRGKAKQREEPGAGLGGLDGWRVLSLEEREEMGLTGRKEILNWGEEGEEEEEEEEDGGENVEIDGEDDDGEDGGKKKKRKGKQKQKQNQNQQKEEKISIGVEESICWRAITGSFAKPNRLTDRVYQLSQMVSKARDQGITIIDLGRALGHDQKSMFHYVRSAVELGIVVKFRTIAHRTRTSRIVHVRYLPTCTEYQMSLQTDKTTPRPEARSNTNKGDGGGDQQDGEEGEDDGGDGGVVVGTAVMTPITPEYLGTNRDLVKSRVLTVLRERGKLGKVVIQEALPTLVGFTKLPRVWRRRWQLMLRSMVGEGLIEQISAISGKSTGRQTSIRCLKIGENRESRDEDKEESEPGALVEQQQPPLLFPLGQIPFERQIIDLLLQAGPTGMLQPEISFCLGQLYSRTVENMLNRLERFCPPTHLADLTIVSVTELFGREKRLRLFSGEGYRQRCQQDGLTVPPSPNPEQYGGWSSLEPVGFYEDVDDLEEYIKTLQLSSFNGKTMRTKRSPLKRDYINPIDPQTGKVKQGRPSKKNDPSASGGVSSVKKKKGRKTAEVEETSEGGGKKMEVDGKEKEKMDDEMEDAGLGGCQEEKSGSGTLAQRPAAPSLPATSASNLDAAATEPRKAATVTPETNRRVSKPPTQSDPPDHGTGGSKKRKVDSREPPPEPPTKRRRTPSKKAAENAALEKSKKSSIPIPVSIGDPLSQATPSPFLPNQKKGLPSDTRRTVRFASQVDTFPPPAEQQSHGNCFRTPASSTNFDPDILIPGPGPASSRKRQRSDDEELQTRTPQKISRPRIAARPSLSGQLAPSTEEKPVNNTAPAPITDLAPDEFPPLDQVSTGLQADEEKTPLGMKGRSSVTFNRKNMTAVRRENELLAMIEELGGIIDYEIEFQLAFMNRFKQNSPHSEYISGSKADKKSITTSLNKLEERGMVKIFRTEIPGLTGPAKKTIAMKSGIRIDSPQFQKFVKDLRAPQTFRPGPSGGPWKTVDISAVDRGPVLPNANPSLGAQLEKAKGDDQATKDAFATEWRIMSQYYGYRYGRYYKARVLHVFLHGYASEPKDPSAVLRSEDHCLISSVALFRDIKLREFLTVVPFSSFGPKLDRKIKANMENPVGTLPKEILQILCPTQAVSRRAILLALECLCQVSLLTPMVYDTEEKRESIPVFHEDGKSYRFEPAPAGQATHWMLARSSPVYDLQLTGSPIRSVYDLRTKDDANDFWDRFKAACLPGDREPRLPDSEISTMAQAHNVEPQFPGSRELSQSLQNPRHWQGDYQLTGFQRDFLKKFRPSGDQPVSNQDSNKIELLADLTFTPIHLVSQFLFPPRKKARKKQLLESASTSTTASRARALPKRSPQPDPEEISRRIAIKARDAQARREKDWDGMIAQFLVKNNSSALDPNFEQKLRNKFLSQPPKLNAADVETELNKWVKRKSRQSVEVPIPRVHFPERKRNDAPAAGPRTSGRARRGPKVKKLSAGATKRKFFTVAEDDLVTDIEVILRSRSARLDQPMRWLDLDSVWSETGRSTDRVKPRWQTIAKKPAESLYRNKLLDTWNSLRREKLQKGELPKELHDDSPFSLKKTRDYLCNNIDKVALRAGAIASVQSERLSTHQVGINLPSSISEITNRFSIASQSTGPATESELTRWDNFWEAASRTSSIHRTITMLDQAFSHPVEEIDWGKGKEVERMRKYHHSVIASVAIRMITVTPTEHFSSDGAAFTLERFASENIIVDAVEYLQDHGILTKFKAEYGRRVPGRNYKFTERFLAFFEQSRYCELLPEASSTIKKITASTIGPSKDSSTSASTSAEKMTDMDTDVRKEDMVEWPLIPDDYEMMALAELASASKLKAKVDIDITRQYREGTDMFLHAIEDDVIENPVYVSISKDGYPPSMPTLCPPPTTTNFYPSTANNAFLDAQETMNVDDSSEKDHGINLKGQKTNVVCLRTSWNTDVDDEDGDERRLQTGRESELVNCEACLVETLERIVSSGLVDVGGDDVKGCWEKLKEAGLEGLDIWDFEASRHPILKSFTTSSPPLAIWVGHYRPRITSSLFLGDWTLPIMLKQPLLPAQVEKRFDDKGKDKKKEKDVVEGGTERGDKELGKGNSDEAGKDNADEQGKKTDYGGAKDNNSQEAGKHNEHGKEGNEGRPESNSIPNNNNKSMSASATTDVPLPRRMFERPFKLSKARCWLDIRGELIPFWWKQVSEVVLETLLTRPGIAGHQLVQICHPELPFLDIFDVLATLLASGNIRSAPSLEYLIANDTQQQSSDSPSPNADEQEGDEEGEKRSTGSVNMKQVEEKRWEIAKGWDEMKWFPRL